MNQITSKTPPRTPAPMENADALKTLAEGLTEKDYEDLLWMMVEETLSCSAHDLDHIRRVYKLAMSIAAQYPQVKYDVLIPAVLLHDLGRRAEDQDLTGRTDHSIVSAVMAGEILGRMTFPKEVIAEVQDAIRSHRYRSGCRPETLEAAILYDADKLDAIGAVGIARTFMMAGQEGARMYRRVDLESYTAQNLTDHGRILQQADHAPNVEYLIKLRQIPDRLLTSAGRAMAQERASLMKLFFDALDKEIGESWEG